MAHLPPQVSLVLTSRTGPPLSLARLRVRRQLHEIRQADLRFSPDEAAAFLNQVMGLNLAAEAVQALETRTEGWIAGLQLAALSLQARADDADRVAEFVRAFSGSHRYVIDYLVEEVVEQQPVHIRDFLSQTAILERITAPLCRAVTGREDSPTILARLEKMNLFLIPLDERRQWYRYHHLFAEFLRTELEPEQQEALHGRAAHWFEAHGYLEEAVRHALHSGQVAETGRLIRKAGLPLFQRGELVTLLGWLDALPDEFVRANSGLALDKAWALWLMRRGREADSYARSAEAALPQEAPPEMRGRLLGLRFALSFANRESVTAALPLARQAEAFLDQAHSRFLPAILLISGKAQEALGDTLAAARAYRRAGQAGQQFGNASVAATGRSMLAQQLNLQGRRSEAWAIVRQQMAEQVDRHGQPLPSAGLAHMVAGELAYYANQLELAYQYVRQGQALIEQGLQTYRLPGKLAATPILAALGKTEVALSTIQEMKQISRGGNVGLFSPLFAALEADIYLHRGDMDPVRRWVQQAGLAATDSPTLPREPEYLVYIRLLLAQQQPGQALALIDRLEPLAQQAGRYLPRLTLTIQRALALAALNRQPEALAALQTALQMAQAETYRRPFLHEGQAVGALLQQVSTAAPAFVGSLLEAFGQVEPDRPAAPVEPLSERELEVLRLLVTELTAPEIADRLVIAASTVRSHVKSIYRKLDAHSRYEAIERARKLGLV